MFVSASRCYQGKQKFKWLENAGPLPQVYVTICHFLMCFSLVRWECGPAHCKGEGPTELVCQSSQHLTPSTFAICQGRSDKLPELSCEWLHSPSVLLFWIKDRVKTGGKLSLLTFKLETPGVVASFREVRSVCLIWVNTRFMLCSSYWLVMAKFPELQEK